MRSERVTTPLRSAPAVVREVTQAVEGFYDSHKYISNGIPAPGDGLEAVKLQHTGKGHECQCIIDCYTCGQNVAETFNEFGVGSGKDSALQYSDVLIISAAVEPKPGTFFEGVISDDDGNIVLSTLGFIQALLAASIPTGMLSPTKRAGKPDHSYNYKEFKRNTLDMVTRRFNRVIISNYACLYGMERRIVVSLPDPQPDWKLNSEFELPAQTKFMGITEHKPAHEMKEDLPQLHVFHGLSRCMVQLVLVEIPEDKTGGAWAQKVMLSLILAGAGTKKTDAAHPGTKQSSSEETRTGTLPTQAAGCEEPKKENNPKNKDESGVSWAKKGFLSPIAGAGTKKTDAAHPGTKQLSSEEMRMGTLRSQAAGCEEPKKENKAARGEIKPVIETSASGKKPNETEQKTQNKRIRDNPKNKDESGVSWAKKGFLPPKAGAGTQKTNAAHPGTKQLSSENVTRTGTAGYEEPKKENKAARGEIKPDIQSSASGKKPNETEQKTQNKQISDNPKNKHESGVSWARKGFLL